MHRTQPDDVLSSPLPGEDGRGSQADQPEAGAHATEREHDARADDRAKEAPEEQPLKWAPTAAGHSLAQVHAEAQSGCHRHRSRQGLGIRRRHRGTRHGGQDDHEPGCESQQASQGCRRNPHRSRDSSQHRTSVWLRVCVGGREPARRRPSGAPGTCVPDLFHLVRAQQQALPQVHQDVICNRNSGEGIQPGSEDKVRGCFTGCGWKRSRRRRASREGPRPRGPSFPFQPRIATRAFSRPRRRVAE